MLTINVDVEAHNFDLITVCLTERNIMQQKWFDIPAATVLPNSKVHGAAWDPPGSCRPQVGPV